MNKKEQRKELELILVKTIGEVLNTRNTVAAKKIKKVIVVSSKSVAKKFYKAIKPAVEKKNSFSKKTTKEAVKTITTKAKAKIKK